jgi:hypothetical protein
MANFWRVLEFDKFAGEWPLLSHYPLKLRFDLGWFALFIEKVFEKKIDRLNID